MKYGTKFKFVNTAIIKQLPYDLHIFIYKNAVKQNLPTEHFSKNKCLIIKYFITQLISLKQNNTVINYKEIEPSINDLKFVITYIDKEASKFALICKRKLY